MSLPQRKILKNLFAKLQKKYREIPALPDEKREILDLLIFAALMENTSAEKACSAFEAIERYFVDWNEVRVSTASDLAELFPSVQAPGKQSERVRRVLQWIFELQYNFDMQKVQGQNAETVLAFLTSIPYSTHFMNDLVMFILFPGRSIPFDEGAMRVMRLLECVDINDENKEVPVGFDFLKTKGDRLTFFALLHELGADLMKEELEPSVRKFLKSIDPDAEFRAWIPLVESNETDDPLLIAKQVIKKERKRHLPAIAIESDLDIDDNFDANPLTEEDDYVSETVEVEETVISETVFIDSDLKSDLMESLPAAKGPAKEKSESKDRAKKQSAKEKTSAAKSDNKDQKAKIEEKNPPPAKSSKKEKKAPEPSVSKEKKAKKADASTPKSVVKNAKAAPKKETVKASPKKETVKSASKKGTADPQTPKNAKAKSAEKVEKEPSPKAPPKKSVKAPAETAAKNTEKIVKEEAESEVKKLQRKKPR
ncbi:MAG: hypothetical protein Q4G69_13720 [Planctomycetia bacterium]|nr:hypothetical protein [Planctomycetia bacterium]